MTKKAKTKEPKTEAPAKVRAALHDADGVFLRMVEVAKSELTELHNPAITECDLPPNAYRWNGTSYVPIRKAKKHFSITAEHAMAAGFMALHEQGIKLPEDTVKWARRYMRAFDEINSVDAGA